MAPTVFTIVCVPWCLNVVGEATRAFTIASRRIADSATAANSTVFTTFMLTRAGDSVPNRPRGPGQGRITSQAGPAGAEMFKCCGIMHEGNSTKCWKRRAKL